jgi:hypothetical protein
MSEQPLPSEADLRVEEAQTMQETMQEAAQEPQGGRVHSEEFQVTGDQLVSEMKRLLHEGNIRRIILKNEEGKTLIEIPLTIGAVAALLFPVWAAIGAIAALAAKLTIVVEKVEK